MPYQAANLSTLFNALADPTRRAVVQRLSRGPASMSTLAEPFSLSLPTISQHLDLLHAAGLVQSVKQGRVRMFSLTPKPLKMAERWMADQRSMWESRLDQLDEYLQTLKAERHP